MREIAHGSHEALATLYRQFASRALVTARRIVGSPECAQEVVCDVFTFVWRNAHAYDPARASVAVWLNVIARNRSIDRWRNNGKHRFFAERALLDGAAVELENPERLLSQSQEDSTVQAALARLSPLRQRLLALAFFQGLSHDEIAETVGMPLGTVKSHVRRALRAMRETLDSSGLDGSRMTHTLRPRGGLAPGVIPHLSTLPAYPLQTLGMAAPARRAGLA